MYIVSGSDQAELRHLCGILNIASYFRSIHGSPTTKVANVAKVVEVNSYKPEQVVLIGDSINDYEAAVENGLRFYGFNNKALIGRVPGYIDDFEHWLSV